MKEKSTTIFQEEIKNIFHISVFDSYKESQLHKTLSFDYGRNGVTFAQLEKLSKLVGSTNINFEGRTEEYHYSEVTYDTERKGDIFVTDIVFPSS